MKPSEALAQAEALLDNGDKWIKRRYIGIDGRCMVGAVRKVVGYYSVGQRPDYWAELKIREALGEKAAEQFPERIRFRDYPQHFNDHPDTTFDDVRKVMEKARIGLEEKGL